MNNALKNLSIIGMLALAVPAWGQAYCALRDPTTHIHKAYKHATSFRSIVRTINSPARELVNQRLPFGIHFNELGRHTLYVVLKAKQPTRQLLDMGLEVTSHDGFETARAGWADAARRVDILITDVSLGDGCGLELAKESMNDDRCRSVLILTGHADMDRLSSMIETYKWGLLLKPFGAAELRDKVRERLQSL